MTKPWLQGSKIEFVEVEGVKVWYKSLSFGEQRAITKETVQIDSKGLPQVDVSLVTVLQTVKAITDWEFTDENENKLPISLHTFDEVLSPEFGGMIIKAVSDKVNTQIPSNEEKKQ